MNTLLIRRTVYLSFALCCLPIGGRSAQAFLFKSGPIQVSADGQWVWAVNPDNDSISRLNTLTEEVWEIPLSDPEQKDAPRGISLREDGSEVWVACHDSDRVLVIDANDGNIRAQIELPWGSGPYSIALSPDQGHALVTLHRGAALAVLSTADRAVTHILEPVYWSPMGIAWTRDGASAWVTHLFAPGEHPLLTRVDFSSETPRVSTSVQIFAADPRDSTRLSAPYNLAEGGYLTMRGHPAHKPGEGLQDLWLPMQYNNITEQVYTPDSTVQSSVRRIDLRERRPLNDNEDKVILTAVHVHAPTGNGAYQGPGWNLGVSGPIDIGFSRDGRMTYVLHELSNDLVIMPSTTRAVKPTRFNPIPEVPVGDRPIGLAVSGTDDRGYVYNQFSRDVSVIDLLGATELKRIPMTPLTGEPFSERVLRGAKLFHTSADPRVSANGKVSCASCHINAEHDGRSWAFHRLPGRHGPREVQTLLGLNRTFNGRDPETGWGQLHRSGDRDEIQDFEHTFRGINMGGTGFLGGAIQPELGAPNAGRSEDLDALADYLLSLEALMRSPFRAADGSLSEAAIRGATFFAGNGRGRRPADAGCIRCHVPETGFVDFKFHDVGQRRPENEQELNSREPRWHVNTATLLGLWVTAPYNGTSTFTESPRVKDNMLTLLLDQAARAGRENAHGTPDGLTGKQLSDLAQFVLSIDGNLRAETVRNARDTAPPRIVRAEATSLSQLDIWFNESVSQPDVELIEAWEVRDEAGERVPVKDAHWDAQNGDRVSLVTSLRPNTRYRLSVTGIIRDLADKASGGHANTLASDAAENIRDIEIGDSLTITLGASGYENITIPVHDAAMVGPGLSTWSHDSVWIFPVSNRESANTGFVRFDWQDAFEAVTGVNQADHILEAAFELHGELGDAQTIEIRRCLKPWSDSISGGDWNRTANGAPTWRDHQHPNSRWNEAGANALRGSGDRVSDYNGQGDLAEVVDAQVEMQTINKSTHFAGPLVTEAYRFWFDHPELDYGYGCRVARGSFQETKFERWESSLHRAGPVLKIRYRLRDP